MRKPKIVSLFSGCGGLDLGFKQLGYDIIWANDILKDACETYRLNIGNHIHCGDITALDKKVIPKADIVIGGPPCQSFSLVGKRDPKDSRSNLVWSYLEVLERVKPKLFILENVTGLLSAKNHDGTKVLDNIIEALDNIGFETSILKLNSADYGVPQKRMRVFIVGSKKKKISVPLRTHEEGDWVSAFEALSDLSDTNDTGVGKYIKKPDVEFQEVMRLGKNGKFDLHFTPYTSNKDKELIKHIPPGGNYTDVPDSISTTRIMNFKKTGGRTTTYGRLSKEAPSYTLNTHFNRLNVGCNIHYDKDRLISLREGLRIQSFPDSFQVVSSTKRNFYVQIGNAVPPLLAKAWASHLLNYF